jgi:hypothetical protein
LLVTPANEVWAVDVSTSTFVLLKGTLSTSGPNFNAQLVAYTSPDAVPVSATGTVVARSSINGTVTGPGGSEPFTLSYSAGYESAPNRAALAGSYSISSGGTVTLNANGLFTGTPNGCSVSGTLQADASGKNFYRVSISFGPAPCELPNGTATGVLAPSGTQLVGGFVSGNSFGDAFVLTRL